MALINIEYGSMASSDTMNKNFSYLDNKISETSDSIMTTISSMLSNIATINSRLSEITGDIVDVNDNLSGFKTSVANIVKATTMVPDWSNIKGITFPYTTKSNGYILTLPGGTSSGTLTVNGVVVQYKKSDDRYESAAQMVSIPVRCGDVINCSVTLTASYFVPVKKPDLEEIEEDN